MSKLLEQINKAERKTSKIGDLFGVKTGGTPSRVKPEFYLKGTVPWVKTQELVDSIIYDTDEKITQEAIKNSNAKVFPKNSVILAMYGATVGKLGILGIDASTNQACATFIPNEKSDIKFLYYLLLKNRQRIISEATGSAQQNLSIDRIRNFEFDFPSLPTQKKIAEILSAYDSKIENNNKIIKNLEATAQTIFNEWFINFRLPAEVLTKVGFPDGKLKMVESEMGEIPEGWEVKSVLDVIERIPVGKKFENKTASPVGKVPILDQGASGSIGYHNEEPGVIASIENPVVVFTNHTCYYRLLTEPFSCIQNVLPYIGKNGYKTLFIYFLTKGKIKMQEYKGHWPEFEQQVFVIPPVELANSFVSKIKSFVSEMVLLEKENISLKSQRDLLLSKLI